MVVPETTDRFRLFLCSYKGIILVAAGEDIYGIAGSIMYAFVFCMVLKLMAVVGQMYGFGVPLGKSVSVRRAVGVNSDLVRSMKIVLRKPGLSIAKVTILTGGPDWPTSVMCGILHLNVFQILLGTLPVAFLILPTILAGSYFYLADRDPKYAALSTIFAAVAAFVQTGAMLIAAYYLDKVNDRRSSCLFIYGFLLIHYFFDFVCSGGNRASGRT